MAPYSSITTNTLDVINNITANSLPDYPQIRHANCSLKKEANKVSDANCSYKMLTRHRSQQVSAELSQVTDHYVGKSSVNYQ
jgi:biotin synthase-related radical SAM superfamily protein